MKIQKVITHKKYKFEEAEHRDKELIKQRLEESIKNHKKEMKRLNRRKKKEKDKLRNPQNYWNKLLK
jgi:hypothetical protein